MFSIDQIKEAHSKVKSGADFPKYIQDLIKLGVVSYESFVTDGHTLYYGANDFAIRSDAKYPELKIASQATISQFQKDLKEHQQGKTDYLTFCKDSANSGVEKWCVNMAKMTCVYFDLAGNEMLAEKIPV